MTNDNTICEDCFGEGRFYCEHLHGLSGPEECMDCGLPYSYLWYAESDLWNRVVGSPNGFLCIACFATQCYRTENTVWLAATSEHVNLAEAATLRAELNALAAKAALCTTYAEAIRRLDLGDRTRGQSEFLRQYDALTAKEERDDDE